MCAREGQCCCLCHVHGFEDRWVFAGVDVVVFVLAVVGGDFEEATIRIGLPVVENEEARF